MKKIGIFTTVFMLSLITIHFVSGQSVSLLDQKVSIDKFGDTTMFTTPLKRIYLKIDSLNGIDKEPKNKVLVSSKTLNTFFKNKLTYFLARKEDIGFFSTYAFLNTADGVFTLGRNKAHFDTDERLYSIFSYALKADIADNFATIFKNDQLSSSLGISLKYTRIGRGTIGFDTKSCQSCPNKEKMDNSRNKIYFGIEKELIKEGRILYKDSLENAKLINLGLLQQSTNKGYTKKLAGKYLKSFYSKEYETLMDEDEDIFSSFHQGWFTIQMYLPITSTKYQTKDNILSLVPNENKFRPWEFGFIYNQAWGKEKGIKSQQGKEKGSKLLQIVTGIKKSNTINSGEVKEESLNNLKFIEPVISRGDTLFKKGQIIKFTTEPEKALVGKYEEFLVYNLGGRLLWYPKFLNKDDVKYGFNLSIDYVNTNGKGRADLGFGIPISLKGKEDDSFINYEVNFRLQDTFGKNNFVAGISVGVPLEKFKFD
jgi:hypothetical protein